MASRQAPKRRLTALESRLETESPGLLPVLRTYRDFDRLLQGMGLLPRGESLATRVPWWPVVAVLGPAGPSKTAFLDSFRTPGGERPEDGRATVLCHAKALPADPRIPFDPADGFRVEASDAERLRGLVLVDVPAGAARPAEAIPTEAIPTEAIPTEAIVELADLVLVFPDAADPGPDALAPVLARAARRADAGKLVTIRSDADLAGIDARLAEAGAARGRRVAGLLAALVEELEDELLPYMEASLGRWRRGVRRGALTWLGVLALVLGGAVILGGTGNLPAFAGWLGAARPPLLGGMPVRFLALAGGLGGLWLAGQLWVRRAAAHRIAARLPTRMGEADLDPRRAVLKSTGVFRIGVAGWGRRARRRLAAIRAAAVEHVRRLGERDAAPQPAVAESAAER